MKSFTQSRADSDRSRSVRRLLVASLALAALAPSFGCVSRKQYAINEAVLISERRQLEDEIYNAQFELRNALEENERLRAQLEGDKDSSKESKERRPVRENVSPKNDSFFPGGDALDISRENNTNVDEDSAMETLPDFVPIRNSRAQRPTRNGVGQASYESSRRGVDVETEDDWAPFAQ